MIGRKQTAASARTILGVDVDYDGEIAPVGVAARVKTGAKIGAELGEVESDPAAGTLPTLGHSGLRTYLRQLARHPLLSRQE